MRSAYGSSDDNFVSEDGKTLYISGTHSVGDVITDLTLPARVLLRRTPRYRESLDMLDLHPEIETVVGHSLGGAIGTALIMDHPGLKGRMYGSPTMMGHKDIEYYRHSGDPVSISNMFGARPHTTFRWGNPHSYKGYDPY